MDLMYNLMGWKWFLDGSEKGSYHKIMISALRSWIFKPMVKRRGVRKVGDFSPVVDIFPSNDPVFFEFFRFWGDGKAPSSTS